MYLFATGVLVKKLSFLTLKKHYTGHETSLADSWLQLVGDIMLLHSCGTLCPPTRKVSNAPIFIECSLQFGLIKLFFLFRDIGITIFESAKSSPNRSVRLSTIRTIVTNLQYVFYLNDKIDLTFIH